LVDEDQPFRVDPRDPLEEVTPLLLALRGVALLGVTDLLLARDLQLLHGAHDRHGTAMDAQALAQFLQRGIGLLADQRRESLELCGAQRGWPSSSMRFGFKGVLLQPEMERRPTRVILQLGRSLAMRKPRKNYTPVEKV